MPLRGGIVGLPNVGKSTLFNALTSSSAVAANYPFATKDPNIGVITVPDPRLTDLAEIVQPKKVTPTTVEIVDIAGLIKGASKGEGLGNQFLANIREVDAIIHLIRCFEDENVVHVDGNIDPVRDKEIIDTELLLKDLETAEKRVERLQKQAKSADKEVVAQLQAVEKIRDLMEQGVQCRDMDLEDHEAEVLRELQLLSAKPVLYVCNVDEASVVDGNEYTEALRERIRDEDAEMILISAGIEAELIELDVEERMEFLEEMGLHEPGVNQLIRAAYSLLHLITFFTAGPKEVRAWTVVRNTKAPKAAGVIHTDFEKGFIRAEVIRHADFIQYGSEYAVKEAGKMSVEGKDYVVQDGDVIYFRFNI